MKDNCIENTLELCAYIYIYIIYLIINTNNCTYIINVNSSTYPVLHYLGVEMDLKYVLAQ